ncbi:MerR family transcriptional regulator [Treponema sp.]|uniref:MerR family transcriptional regulator n=1 Tax=Treponema sp. TaxID=166 RepID=UPI0025FCEA91|nr:MerR family transcriptional regulator [Treponema sp.]MCR5218542.1 MerR family transcriptional regulator [Treponema sp.]
MSQFTIGQVEKLTGIKAHVLRYWEEVVPAIAPKKTVSGRRVYTQRHLDIILRMKYLIHKKGLSIEGARNRILQESARFSENASSLERIHLIRKELADLYLRLQETKINEK